MELDCEVLLCNTSIYLSGRDLYALSQTCKSVYVNTQHSYNLQDLWLARCQRILHTKLHASLTDNWRIVYTDLVRLDNRAATTVTNELSILLYLDSNEVTQSTEGASVLAMCVREGYTEALRRFLPLGDNPWRDDSVELALKEAIKRGHIRVIQLVAEDKRARETIRFGDAAALAANYGQTTVVQFLLDLTGRNIATVENCLLKATFSGHADLVSLLLEDARVSSEIICLLLNIVSNVPSLQNTPNLEVVRVLMSDPRFDPTWAEHLPLRAAYVRGDRVLMKQLCSDPRVTEEVKNKYSIERRDRYQFAFRATLAVGVAYFLYRSWKE